MKLLILSSFSHNVFLKAFFLQPFPKQALVFSGLLYKSFENTVGKGEIARNKQFLLFPVFSNRLENFLPFSSNLKSSSANSFNFGRVLNLSFGKGLNSKPSHNYGINTVCVVLQLIGCDIVKGLQHAAHLSFDPCQQAHVRLAGLHNSSLFIPHP